MPEMLTAKASYNIGNHGVTRPHTTGNRVKLIASEGSNPSLSATEAGFTQIVKPAFSLPCPCRVRVRTWAGNIHCCM